MAEGGRERFVGIVCIGLIENQLRNGMAEKGSHTVLVVDDDPGHRGMLEALLGRWGLAVTSAGDGKEAVARVCERPFDVVLMDIRMPDMDGITALKEIRKYNPAVPVVLMTAYSAVESAVEAMKSGAVDYLIKPLDFDQLKSTLFKTLEHSEAVRSGERFPVPVEGIVGNSPAVRRMLEMIHTVAPSEATVLINGKSGTGKELAARAVHECSARCDKPFIAVNCGAIPDALLESELFGHARGAFTGATSNRKGRFAQADGGTLFLDEIGELPMPMQTRLLRFLQDWEIMRVGSTTPKQIDVRIVAATNKNLERAIARGEFRSDLYYRLKVAVIAIPPLRDRQADILPLARMFLRFYGSKYHRQLAFSEEAESLLLDYKWPGNIRELENLVQGLAVTSKDSVIRASDVPISGVAKPAASARRDDLDFELDGKTYKEIMKDLENKVLSAAMERYGSITEVARHFQVDRSTIFRKVKELEKEGKMR